MHTQATKVSLNEIKFCHFNYISVVRRYVSQVDVCIIDEATQCNEPLTLLPFQFGMPSLILVGDSQLVPLSAYSPVSLTLIRLA